ncbi:MAG: hypothetical protein ACEPOZ_14045 [Marinifilaceae bacterium]
MKLLKLTLITSTFLIMVAAVFNLLNTTGPEGSKTGIYIELVVMFLLTVAMVLVNNQEKKLKQLQQQISEKNEA